MKYFNRFEVLQLLFAHRLSHHQPLQHFWSVDYLFSSKYCPLLQINLVYFADLSDFNGCAKSSWMHVGTLDSLHHFISDNNNFFT